jgi:hypothetical protein
VVLLNLAIAAVHAAPMELSSSHENTISYALHNEHTQLPTEIEQFRTVLRYALRVEFAGTIIC